MNIMLSIVLSNRCTAKLDILKCVPWIIVKEPTTKCNVLITECIMDIDETIMQIVFIDHDMPICIPNVYVIRYKDSLNSYLDCICETIRNKIAVHVFGDSHSIITHKVTICRENWLGFNTNYPLTMFRFGKEGLDLHECIRVMGNGHEHYPIREGDIAMYSYGEIDIRYLLLKNCNREEIHSILSSNQYNESRELNLMIDNIISSYIKQIKYNEERFKCKSYVYFIVPPVQDIDDMSICTGTLEERKLLYSYVTEKLYTECQLNDIPIISIYDTIIGDDGLCKLEYLVKKGDLHINNDYYYLIRDALMNQLCNSISLSACDQINC